MYINILLFFVNMNFLMVKWSDVETTMVKRCRDELATCPCSYYFREFLLYLNDNFPNKSSKQELIYFDKTKSIIIVYRKFVFK